MATPTHRSHDTQILDRCLLHYLLQVSLALQGSSGPVYKQLRQAISLPYPGVLRGTYDHTNGAVSSFSQTTGRRPLLGAFLLRAFFDYCEIAIVR